MRHGGQVGDDRLSVHILAERDRDFALGRVEIVALQQLAKSNLLLERIRDFDADSVLPRNRRENVDPLGASRSGNPEAAKADIAKLGELRDKLLEAKDGYWSEQVDIQQKIASAWVLYAEGKYDDALKAMSAAADAEDKTEKHPVTPGVPRPARELYGVMLLERGMPNEALAAFEATLKKEPNRLGAYVGAAKAAEKAGDSGKARTYYEKVVAIAADADKTRTDVTDARAHLK